MEKSTKKKLLIGGSVLVIGGILAYLFYKNKKDMPAQPEQPQTAPSKEPEKQASKSPATDQPSDVIRFQTFANSKGEKLSVDGAFGPKTAAAWSKWKSAYNNSLNAGVETGIKTLKLVNATDFLAGGRVNDANGKNAFAKFDGMQVYNMNNQKSFTTTKNKLLGKVFYADKNNVYFFSPDGVRYWVTQGAAMIQTN